ncbi:NAD-dependent protein deacetylase Sirt7 [Plodia interpunctella]|uniref:NAD-dependent protein deacetylase Sirt7 n=1 Tax=Plodia interpunctella TaxID=58824 RepID=UPI002367D4DA|nr:NAD-dependent protein deacetylase Sirt7 [Plodia interpunctella]
MEARGVRSSARLSGEAARNTANGTSGGALANGNRRPLEAAEAAAAAAQRRARALERSREVEDSPRVLRDKCRRLARALRNAKHLVVYTGAGISTAADIPDYRGPHGVWTRLQRGETVGRVEVSRARPTFTHMALTALWARGLLKFVVSQNCDGLHLRSGLPRRALAELHGDMFCELCAACRRVFVRAFDTTERTARHAHGTRRLCHRCGAELRDSIVHFGERGRAAWPLNWAGALRHAARADVVLCLGSSLKVLRRYPRLWRMHAAPRARPALYIVNLQWTPKDSVAALKINARCDAVMRQVARRLRLRVPRYRTSRDPLLAHAEPLAEPEAHTTRRPHLSPARSSGYSSPRGPLSSPSASDSDEELPLRRLAERLRRPAADRASASSEPPDLLRAFRVNMCSGEATILLRAEHAPPPPAPPPSASAPPLAPPPAPPGARRELSELRRFRMPQHERPPPPPRRRSDVKFEGATNGRALDVVNGHHSEKPAELLDVKIKDEDVKDERIKCEPWEFGDRLRKLLELEPERSEKAESSDALAAAIIARAVLVCRASLYPGLHTILAPAPAAECGWCWRRRGSARCLWYGAPRAPPPEARAWRRVRGRRYLCACCGADGEPPPPPAAAPDDAGWYGKGYRKGRRRRR